MVHLCYTGSMVKKRTPAKKPTRKRRTPRPAPPSPRPRAAVYITGATRLAVLRGLALLEWAERSGFDVVTVSHDGPGEEAKFSKLKNAVRSGDLLAVIVDARHPGRVNIPKMVRLFVGFSAKLIAPPPGELQTFLTLPDLPAITDVLNEQIGISATAARLNLSVAHVSLARIAALAEDRIHFDVPPTPPRPEQHEPRWRELQ